MRRKQELMEQHPKMDNDTQQRWLVTGAAGALGQALVEHCLRAGYDCIALDRNRRGLNELHDRLEKEFGRAPALMPMDLAGSGPDDYQQLAEAVAADFGRIDVLIHNAASFKALRPVLHQPPGEWLEIIQTSITAPFMLSAVLAPLMPENSLNVLITDQQCLEQPSGWGAYGIAQAARGQMKATLAAERGRSGPGVIEVDPGVFYSTLRVAAWPSDSAEELPTPEAAAQKVIAAVHKARDKSPHAEAS